jgi:hypothetical protein
MNSRKTLLPSDRSFGFLFAGIFVCLSVFSTYRAASAAVVIGYFASGVIVGLVAVFAPTLLRSLNKIWMKLGEIMGKIVSPLVLCIIFFALFSPVALFIRLFGRDELRLKKLNIGSYWVDRKPPGPAGDSYKNQF